MLITPKATLNEPVIPYIEFPWEFGKIRLDYSQVQPEREIGGRNYREPITPLRGLPVLHMTAAGGDSRYYGGAFPVNRVNYSFAVHLIATTFYESGGPLGLAIPSSAYGNILLTHIEVRRAAEDGGWLSERRGLVTDAARKRIHRAINDFITRLADPTPFPGTLTSPEDHLRELIRIGLANSLHETQTKAQEAKHDLQALALSAARIITRCDNTDNRADVVVAMRTPAYQLAREVDSTMRGLPKDITTPS